jgi:hypothetical protein
MLAAAVPFASFVMSLLGLLGFRGTIGFANCERIFRGVVCPTKAPCPGHCCWTPNVTNRESHLRLHDGCTIAEVAGLRVA